VNADQVTIAGEAYITLETVRALVDGLSIGIEGVFGQ
jgi:hypothetical protein